MAAKRRRFAALDNALRKGQTGAKLEAYKNWRAEGAPATATAPAMPAKGAGISRAVLPFFSSTFTDSAIIRLTTRAQGALASLGLSEAILNLETVPEEPVDPATYEVMDGLRPAKIVCFKPGSGTTNEKSRITNVTYKKRAGATYTLPFGRKDAAGKRDQKGMRAQLLSKLVAGVSGSFKEEIYIP